MSNLTCPNCGNDEIVADQRVEIVETWAGGLTSNGDFNHEVLHDAEQTEEIQRIGHTGYGCTDSNCEFSKRDELGNLRLEMHGDVLRAKL